MFAEPIASPLDVDDDSVVKKAVQQGCRDHGIAEDLPPFGKAAVGGQNHGAAFVAGIDQLEEQVAGTRADAEVADLIDLCCAQHKSMSWVTCRLNPMPPTCSFNSLAAATSVAPC